MRYLLVTLFILFCPLQLWSKSKNCYGPSSAKHGIIYLHGLDEPKMEALERNHRKLLGELAQQLKIRIATPRSSRLCSGKLCWNHSNQRAVEDSLAYVLEQSKTCLKDRTLRSLIGFSNGAYLVNKAFQLCRRSDQRLLFIGIGGLGELGKGTKIDPKFCGHLQLMSGQGDLSRRKIEQLAQNLEKRYGEKVQIEIYPGAHYIHKASLSRKLEAWLKQLN